MLKGSGVQLRAVLLDLMNSVVKIGAPTPQEWHDNVIKVVFKSGEMKHAKNYRPICVLPLLYKLFSIMLYRRLQPTLDKELQKDQAGFRKCFNTVDHLHAFTQIQEKTAEWQIELWTCFLDFQKAFDSVEHDAIWAALAKQNVSAGYIEILKRLSASQVGRVSVLSQLSRPFALGRGTKQGDPLSTLLFNAVLEDAFREVRTKWKTKRCGLEMNLGTDCHCTSLCFADDVLLLASSCKEISEIMKDIIDAARLIGLEAHDGKTKVLTNADVTKARQLPASLQVDGRK